MNLALFDLDHTLIAFDSGMAWTHFLVERSMLPADAEETYLGYCRQYVAGTLDIHAMHRASVAPLARIPRELLAQQAREFESVVRERASADMLDLVRRHLEAGDVCALVTATTHFIAEPCAGVFGLEHVIATEAATLDGTPSGAFTGEIEGLPCFREHKVTRVKQWLAQQAPGGCSELGAFERSWFYSDSTSDLPRPDPRLREHAMQAGWRIVEAA